AAMQMLAEAGYEHYEISNYARPGFSSAHNLSYWAGENYLGLGPSAYSTVGTRRWQNIADYRSYADKILAGNSVISSVEEVSEETKRREQIALGLRTRSGVPSQWLEQRPNERDEFVALGLLRRRNR